MPAPMDEVTALGALIDRTYTDVLAAARQPRRLDRERLISVFDMWDNHLIPAVAAAAYPMGRARSASARAVWRSMSATGGPVRRAWLEHHLTDLGLDATALLGPWQEPVSRPYLGHLATIQPGRYDLDPVVASHIAADYDIHGGRVEHARIEIVSPHRPELTASAQITAPHRRYAGHSEADPDRQPKLAFTARSATAVTLTHVDRGAAGFASPLTIATAGTTAYIRAALDAGAFALSGVSISYAPRDERWHESGHAAGQAVGPDTQARHLPSRLGPAGLLRLAHVQHTAMIIMRRMRYPENLRRVEMEALATLLMGCGGAMFAAARSRRCDQECRRILDELRARGGAAGSLLADAPMVDPHGLFDSSPTGFPRPRPLTPDTANELQRTVRFTSGRLRMVDLFADRRDGRDDRTVLHLDARRVGDGGDTVVIFVLDQPVGSATLTVDEVGQLNLVAEPRFTFGDGGVQIDLPLAGRVWSPRAAHAAWYAD